MNSKQKLASLILIFGLFGVVAFSNVMPSYAIIPGAMRGMDAPTVLAIHEHVRHLTFNTSHNSATAQPNRPLQQVRTIVLDPGHGGTDGGATGVSHVHEKYLTLELAYLLRQMLQEKYPEVRVVMTRYWDTYLSLTERMHLANMAEGDLFISLHYNAAHHDRAVGFETYFLVPNQVTPDDEVAGEPIAASLPVSTGHGDFSPHYPARAPAIDLFSTIQHDLKRARLHQESGLLAEIIQARLRRHVPSADRGVKQENFGVLRGALMPAVVVEAAFLTHREEGHKAIEASHRQSIATALVQAIEIFDATLASRNE